MADDRTRTRAGAPPGGSLQDDSMEQQARAAKERSRRKASGTDRTTDGPTDGTARLTGDAQHASVDDASDTAEKGRDRVKQKARGKIQSVKHDAETKAREARDEVERKGDEWTSSLGRRTGRLAHALRTSSDTLRDEGENTMADMADTAADQIDRMAGYLEDEDPAGMLHDLEDMGRRNPAAFLGVTFTLGLAAARFLKASRPESDGAAHREEDSAGSPPQGGRYARASRPSSRPGGRTPPIGATGAVTAGTPGASGPGTPAAGTPRTTPPSDVGSVDTTRERTEVDDER